MLLPISKWSLHCTNPECGTYFEQHRLEPDVICSRCGSFVEINEKITFINKKEENNNDFRSN